MRQVDFIVKISHYLPITSNPFFFFSYTNLYKLNTGTSLCCKVRVTFRVLKRLLCNNVLPIVTFRLTFRSTFRARLGMPKGRKKKTNLLLS